MPVLSPPSSVIRLPDWPARLNALIERRRHMPFKWGLHDCCQFARAAVAELRGADPAAGLGKKLRPYKRCSGAALNLHRLGGVEALPMACGLEEMRVTMAQRGDVVLVDQVREPSRVGSALGICLGEQSAFPAKRGLVFVATLECRRAWRV